MSERLKLEGSLKQAYVQALRLRLAQAKRHDLEALMALSCNVCREVLRIVLKEGLKSSTCDLCPIDLICHAFTAKRFRLDCLSMAADVERSTVITGWNDLVAWLEGLLEEASE